MGQFLMFLSLSFMAVAEVSLTCRYLDEDAESFRLEIDDGFVKRITSDEVELSTGKFQQLEDGSWVIPFGDGDQIDEIIFRSNSVEHWVGFYWINGENTETLDIECSKAV